MGKHFSHLTWSDRLYIEKLYNKGNTPQEIDEPSGMNAKSLE